jgi:peptide-methionine (S)-S-oxide reductase
MATAVFAAGCFWGVEARFADLPGVTATEVGYTGGTTPEPTYRQVSSHKTGHAEAVRVQYDPQRIGYEDLLAAFFAMHDPTTVDRQGPDVGSQYRSAIFTLDGDQDKTAREYASRLDASGRFSRPIATRIEPAGTFWRAEEHHQRYFQKHGRFDCAI